MSHDSRDRPSPPRSSSAFVPMAERIAGPDLASTLLSPATLGLPGQPAELRPCNIDLRDGCYRIAFLPTLGTSVFQGTLRIETAGLSMTASGDLYRMPGGPPGPGLAPIPDADIPIFPRRRYHSYLVVTSIQKTPPMSAGPCQVMITMQEYEYTQPPPGEFDGTFPRNPSRTITAVLSPQVPPTGFSGGFFSGKLFEAGAERGAFTLGWVSSFFRKATVEIDSLAGAVAPLAVPAPGGGTEDFRTIFATAGWDVTPVYDQTNVPIPAGVNAVACWNAADLHALMVSARSGAGDLDTEWRLHLIVVPARLGCGRGVMYDDGIGAPREGVASFSDDGYPAGDSPNFGAAKNQMQRDVPRAFLRSAAHEICHGFNQQHQEITGFGEPGADNSIMTTTPSVADVLAGTGRTFPDGIALRVNDHVRQHLIHFPDPVVRPGGMTFGTGHTSLVPGGDSERIMHPPTQLELQVEPEKHRIKLGEALSLTWTLTNRATEPIAVPSDLRLEAQHAKVAVVDPAGRMRILSPVVIQTDKVRIQELKPGEALSADAMLFWGPGGFAFTTPGGHRLEIQIVWNNGGVAYGVAGGTDVWVDYPVSDADNEVASQLMHPEVGLFVALGGGANHLPKATARIKAAMAAHSEHPACQTLAEVKVAGAPKKDGKRSRTTESGR
jgi:hypothetical protein